MYHFFIEPHQIGEELILIEGPDVRHIRNVLRMKPGEEVLLSDGAGHDYTCRIEELTEQEVICRILSREASGTEPAVEVYLYQGLPKSDKLEHIIQKSVELGVHSVIPVACARSVARYEEKKLKNKLERWNKIAESAAKQSRRGIIPRVENVMSFQDALDHAKTMDLVLIPYENFKDMERTRQVLSMVQPGMKIGIFVGPEGGFEQSEVEKACADKAAGGAEAEKISLGSRILRTETAPLMLLSVLIFQMEP